MTVSRAGVIDIQSASAGTGKTHRIATALEQEVSSGRVRPHAILATTFTNKAAAELAERVRAFLLGVGRADEAQCLAASRIGTVNSVCGRLVSDFAFELGYPPRLRVLDARRSKRLLERAFSDVLLEPERTVLARLHERFGDFDWRAIVGDIVGIARSSDLPPERLAECAERSVGELVALLDPRAASVETLERPLLAAIVAALDGLSAGHDPTAKTRDASSSLRRGRARLEGGQPLAWSDWIELHNTRPGKKSEALFVAVHDAAARVLAHPALHDELATATRLVFDLARRALGAYANMKRDWGLVDFVDQERLALEALRHPAVRERLQGELDLVLVDEFQDTSPLELAIFLELSQLARRSVWVGDQKQSIFGFRGTDPTLMDAAIEGILAGDEPRTLDTSYRSRPALVALTSDLFAEAFAAQGIPPARVRLRPARSELPELGPHAVEVWHLAGRNRPTHAQSLAAGVRRLLEDRIVKVQDRVTGEFRPAKARDVAVLCRTNDACGVVAGELARLGLHVELPRSQLTRTLHGTAALAGLALWVDDGDALAAAELARIIDYADRPDDLLAEVIAAPYAAAFAHAPWLARLRASRNAAPAAGPVAALEAVFDALGLRELCRGWPDPDHRLADLDALRDHALDYVHDCLEDGLASTPAGLLEYLRVLGAEATDERAGATQGDAVTVSTWHRAKGLEWPVVVLYDLHTSHSPTPLGQVAATTDGAAIDLSAPLAGRWIRFWPSPFGARRKVELLDRIAAHPSTVSLQARELRQNLRLLYVGWTRARDYLVLAGPPGVISGPLSNNLGVALEEPASDEDGAALRVRWGRHPLAVVVRGQEPAPARRLLRLPAPGYDMPAPTAAHPPAYLRPSASEGVGVAQTPTRIGERLLLRGRPDITLVGEAVHAFLAADRDTLSRAARLDLARGLLDRWTVASALEPESLVRAGDSLSAWAAQQWPGARWRREYPVMLALPNGTLVTGRTDLVLELPDGVVVIDHKSFPGALDEALARAASFAGQLTAYADAVSAATGKRVHGKLVHLPLIGVLVAV